MKNPYWLVKWDNTTRISERRQTKEEAMVYCFGLAKEDMQAVPFSKKWSSLSQKQKQGIEAQFKAVKDGSEDA